MQLSNYFNYFLFQADLLNFLLALTEHATGVSPDMEQLTEILPIDHSPAIDVQHQDSLGMYIPLSTEINFSYTGPTSSSTDADFDEAPTITIFPEHFMAGFPRFCARERFLSQAIDLSSVFATSFRLVTLEQCNSSKGSPN